MPDKFAGSSQMADETHVWPIFGLGVVTGSAIVGISVPLAPWPAKLGWHLTATDNATLLSGFGGAALGGVVSWLLAKQATRETLRRDENSRISQEKSVALGVTLKAQQIANGYYTHKKYFDECMRRANANKMLNRPLWEIIKPLIGNSLPRPTFEPTDFVPLVNARQAPLIDRCNLLALRYDVAESSLEVYTQKRQAMQEMLAQHSGPPDRSGRVETVIPSSLRPKFRVMASELEDLIVQIKAFLKEDFIEGKSVCDELGKAFREYFSDPTFFSLEIPDEPE